MLIILLLLMDLCTFPLSYILENVSKKIILHVHINNKMYMSISPLKVLISPFDVIEEIF